MKLASYKPHKHNGKSYVVVVLKGTVNDLIVKRARTAAVTTTTIITTTMLFARFSCRLGQLLALKLAALLASALMARRYRKPANQPASQPASQASEKASKQPTNKKTTTTTTTTKATCMKNATGPAACRSAPTAAALAQLSAPPSEYKTKVSFLRALDFTVWLSKCMLR